MHTSRSARKIVAGVSAAVVSLLLVGGAAAAVSAPEAGRGIQSSYSTVLVEKGRGIR
jgi:hypothetical protein